jgi:hypothetical protein
LPRSGAGWRLQGHMAASTEGGVRWMAFLSPFHPHCRFAGSSAAAVGVETLPYHSIPYRTILYPPLHPTRPNGNESGLITCLTAERYHLGGRATLRKDSIPRRLSLSLISRARKIRNRASESFLARRNSSQRLEPRPGMDDHRGRGKRGRSHLRKEGIPPRTQACGPWPPRAAFELCSP